MTRFALSVVLHMGVLAGLLPHASLAQPVTLGASTPGVSFSMGFTLNNGSSFVTSALTTDAAKVLATIKPLDSQLGQGDIYFVANAGPVTYMRNTSGNFEQWAFGSVPTLKPWKQTTLTATTSVDLLEGLGGIPVAGTFAIYIGYKGVDGALVYTTTPLTVTITTPAPAKTALELAQDYYLSGSTPSISSLVQINPGCIACHISGGVASSFTSMLFRSGNVSYNVDQFKNMVKSRGRLYILNTTLGQNDHTSGISGGRLFNTSDAGYKNLDTFLQMLEKL